MIRSFDYSGVITKQKEIDAIRKIDDLFLSDNWCKTVPKYQTWSDLFRYKELSIFADTFKYACMNYDISGYNDFKFWCYMDYASNEKDRNDLWHSHAENGLSGVYYLSNPENVYTEFESFEVKDVKPFSWHIFPSNIRHRPPLTLTNAKRYTLAADYANR